MGIGAWMALLVAAQAQVIEPRTTTRPMPRGDLLLKVTMLGAHADARRAVGLPPMIWDDALAASARRYAAEMARTGRFAHADQPLGGPLRQGENLWSGTRDAYTYREMADAWVAEQRQFVNGIAPAFSRTGRYQDVTHYAQIVWRGTTRIGCALARGRTEDFLVCRYSPAGNVVGQRAY